MSITHNCDFIPVCSVGGDSSDHKVLVDNLDGYPAYVLDKVSTSSLIKMEADPAEAGKFLFLVNTDRRWWRFKLITLYFKFFDRSNRSVIYRHV